MYIHNFTVAVLTDLCLNAYTVRFAILIRLKKINFIGSQVQYTVFNSYEYNYDLLMPHARLLNGK